MLTQKTQAQTILWHLQELGRITPLEALNLYGCFRLAPRIHELRAQGHDIRTTMVDRDGKSFAEYTLEKKKAGRDETHLGLLCESAHAQTLSGEQSRRV
jgi:hypothetical protein